MNKITITRGTRGGEKFATMRVDDDDELFILPRRVYSEEIEELNIKLTTARPAPGWYGIFECGIASEVVYGGTKKLIEFPGELDILDSGYTEFVSQFLTRIKVVQEWVATVDWEESIEFDPDGIIRITQGRRNSEEE